MAPAAAHRPLFHILGLAGHRGGQGRWMDLPYCLGSTIRDLDLTPRRKHFHSRSHLATCANANRAFSDAALFDRIPLMGSLLLPLPSSTVR
jgi:hypothetical protein